jgi:hypothetical protein
MTRSHRRPRTNEREVESATDEDLDRLFGPDRLFIGISVEPSFDETEEPPEDDEQQS